MREHLRLEVTLTKADIIRGRLLAYFRSGMGILIAGAGVAFTANSVFLRFRRLTDQPFAPAELLPGILGAFLIPLAVALAGMNGQAIKNVLGPLLQYDFSDSGFRFSAPNVTARIEWTQVRRAYESSNYFVLSTPGTLQILPKHAIEGGAISELRTLLKETLGKKAKLKKVAGG
jgi:YcxB-like protein